MGKQKLTFEQALGKLEKIVEQIESGQIGLEESIARYEEGTTLIKQCRTILDAAEKRIQLLAKGDAGQLAASGELEEPGSPGRRRGKPGDEPPAEDESQ